MPAPVPVRLPRRSPLGAEYLGLRPFPAGGLPAMVDLAPAYPGYVLFRRRFVRRILAHPDDICRTPFIVQYDILRKLRAHDRGPRRFAKRPLLPVPKYNKRGRWQLDVVFYINGVRRRTGYHRLVGLSVCPCTTDSHGYECDPFRVRLGDLTLGLYDDFWEVHHGNGNPRDNTAGNLYTLWWEVHSRLPRDRRVV